MRSRTSRFIRGMLRDMFVLLAVVFTSPLWIPARAAIAMGMSNDFFYGCSQTMSLIPGKVGVFLRRGFYWMCLEAFSRDCHIEFGTCFPYPQVKIGKGVYIGVRCIVASCEIGDHALIGSNVDILDGRYQHRFDAPDTLVCDQRGGLSPIRIGRNAWIGNSAVVMADVGDNSVIGAGSVVVKPIPPDSVAVGNPAIVKRRRDETCT